MSDTDHRVHRARFADLDNHVLYEILKLRSEVFVVEQECVFLDPDDRDHEPEAEHLWILDDHDEVLATLRILHENGDIWSIGRVVTRADHRSHGAASALMSAALERLGAIRCTEVVIGAQERLTRWYERFGFEVHGDRYVEDGIPHVPMRRTVEAPA